MGFSIKKMTVSILLSFLIILVILGGLGFLLINFLGNSDQAGVESIAVINIHGPISVGGTQEVLSTSQTNASEVIKQINEAKDNKKIKALLLRVNSPGGSSAASDEIYRELKKFKKTGKPVVISMGDIATSGGYYISAIADQIYANPSTITGSIGVIMQFKNLQDLYDKLGVDSITFKSGPYKDIGNPDRKLTAEEKELLQNMVDEVYQEFLTAVAEGRSMSKSKVEKLADGRIYNGRKAKKLGLVDEMGTFYDAVKTTAKLAEMKADPNLIYYNRSSPLERFFRSTTNLIKGVLLQQGLKINSNNPNELYYHLLQEEKVNNLELEY
ncbi:signal peptide peptidase SppA [Acetohalobium arabaticum]|uniref:Signal peptide peptidase SppA, 36K type n=1 Tax=Acetohalobium arabaticum (strain ATCC 49924 / DSM 5501 / Z-7288) TaxID=574087 RepID=D9QSA6_ACEAZ|nr:signal peptide peptidase SppA [Acetohalobium arabaticum]ADL11562.1 signal peptide peptidase SppA, 36K type [Acetohalobium arabaticum DSM 5501]